MAKKKKMLNTVHYKKKSGSTTLEIDLSRFEKQFQEAQFALDSMVMTDMKPFMPMETGTFYNVTAAQSAALAGSGKVVAAAAPMGRFLYEGKVMVDPETGSPWARKGAKKVVTDKSLNYSKNRNPKATDHWFDKAKKQYGDNWVKIVKRIAGGGK